MSFAPHDPSPPRTLPAAAPLSRVLREAEDIARATGRSTNTAHVLLALFTVRNHAERLLAERGIDEDRLLDALPDHPRESAHALNEVLERASQVAASCGAREVSCLHLLVAMTRAHESLAAQILEKSGEKLATLRTRALTVLTGAVPRWVEDPARDGGSAREALSRIDGAAEGRVRRSDAPTTGRASNTVVPRPVPPSRGSTGRPGSTARADRKAALDWSPPLVPPKMSRRSTIGIETTRRANEARERRRAVGSDTLDETDALTPRATLENAARTAHGREERPRQDRGRDVRDALRLDPGRGAREPGIKPSFEPPVRPSIGLPSRPSIDGSIEPRRELRSERPASEARGGPRGRTGSEPSLDTASTLEPLSTLEAPSLFPARSVLADLSLIEDAPLFEETSELAPLGRSAPPEDLDGGSALQEQPESPWRLSPSEYPWLTSLGRNLSLEATSGQLDRLVGREKEVEELIDILGKRRANNPCLVGEPGVGKTAVVEGLAQRLAEPGSPPQLHDRIVVALDVGALLVGTHLRGSFSEKLQGLKEEVKRSGGRVIVFFDELHTLVGAGSTGDGPQDAANELKAALARGDFPCIGATTRDEYVRHIEPDAALRRRFYPVLVREPSREDALEMLRHITPAYSEHHGVEYAEEALAAAVTLSSRYITDRHLPDKAIALLDLAGSRAARGGSLRVGAELIAELVAEQTDLPVARLLASDRERMLDLESHLEREIVGHKRQLTRIAEVIRRNAAGFSSRRPQGVFLFLGPTGVGKTETAKALAKVLHGSEDMMIRFDLSEFAEAHTLARLVGAPPGYVGHDAGGQLTEAVRRRPGRVVLFDEIEKAHRDVLQVLLQILDEGRLTDGRGQTVSFAETIIIMTSNLGADLAHLRRPIGFVSSTEDEVERAILERARGEMPPELWARIEERLVFAPLSRAELQRIAQLLAEDSSNRLMRERGIRYTLDDAAIDYLLDQGGADTTLGARPMRQILARIVEAPIASRILEGRIHADEHVYVSVRASGGLAFLVGDDRTSLSQRPRHT